MTTHTSSEPTGTEDNHTTNAIAELLAEAESARVEQLASLPDSKLDPVGAAHRQSVERILREIRVARRRLAEGSYGTCARCGTAIAGERLKLRPWATTCARCAERSGY